MSLRKLLCVMTLLVFTAVVAAGCTGPADNGGAPAPSGTGTTENTTNN
jgi:hypothetical protein